MTERVLRIVAAAGAGRRMGAIKALLDLGGQSALARIARLELQGLLMDTIVVVGHAARQVGAEAHRLGLEVVVNEAWEQGQTGSIQAALARPEAEAYRRFLLHPVDLPLIAQSTYDQLAAVLREGETEVFDLVATSIDRRRGHPLVFGQTLREAILGLGADDSIRELITSSGARVRHVEVSDPWIRQDLDHPEDLAAARSYLASSGESTSP